MYRRFQTLAVCLLALCAVASPAGAQTGGMAEAGDAVAPDGTGRALPAEVLMRDADGNTTLRATRLPEGLTIDGRLDEDLYRRVPAASGFIQADPDEGRPATEQSEVWVAFDQTRLYVAARLHDSSPDRMVANEMRRDGFNLINNENFGVILDTFHDRRNGFLFHTNPVGGMYDGVITDENDSNADWNTVWWSASGRFDGGWTVEMAIPFKSLRYREGGLQTWGINFRRIVRWKNEVSYLTPIPRSYGIGGIKQLSRAATLVGVEVPASSRNLELKPYAISGLSTDREADPAVSNDLTGDVGFDVKYGLTQGLIADLTYNTDFAQVEDDEQQVNLTRFSLYFPEKREFFLEGQGVFAFGGVGGGGRGGGGGGNDTPILFFSRRIGLDEDADGNSVEVPIRVGGRITGKQGAWGLGFLNIQTGDAATAGVTSTNFTVARVRRDILRRSYVGAMATIRTPQAGEVSQAYGADAGFAFGLTDINTYWAQTRNPGVSGDNQSYHVRVNYNGDRFGYQAEQLMVGPNFQPEVGFLRREDFTKSRAQVRWSPRPAGIAAIRRFRIEPSFEYFENSRGFVETRQAEFQFQTEFESGDQVSLNLQKNYEGLEEGFTASDLDVPAGAYDNDEIRLNYNFGPQRRVGGWLNLSTGSFYGGTRRQVRWNGRVEVTPQVNFEPQVTLNWLDLPSGSTLSKLLGLRGTWTLTPRMFVGSLVQFNSSDDALSSNFRFSWEFEPGSNLFVVYTEGRDTDRRGFPLLQNRSFVVKMAKLFRF
ncbi:MAG: DUF5916 domain-containing protein [Vicinamibacterales bacterium]